MHINRTLSQNQGTFFEKSGRYFLFSKKDRETPRLVAGLTKDTLMLTLHV